MEKREDRWVKLVCAKCNGSRFNILEHETGETESFGVMECKTCGRVTRVTITEVAPAMAGITG